MKIFNRLSIRDKIVVIVLIISIITISTGMVIEYYFEKKRQQESIIHKTQLDALLITQDCILPMDFGNKEAAKAILEKLEVLPEIHDCVLYDSSDSIFAFYSRSGGLNLKPPDRLKEKGFLINDEWLHVYQPIDYKGINYGFLYLKAFTNIVELSRKRIIGQIVLIGAMTIFALILTSFFQRVITRPIYKLTNFTKNISDKADYSLRIEKHSNDEIGQLYDEFNKMLSVTETSKKDLETHKAQLEGLVKLRTKALISSNEKLMVAKEAAETANKVKSEFLSNMSHELRTPLNGILGYAQILINIGNLNKTQKEYVEIIYSSGKHLLDLISEILSYSKIEAEKLQLQNTDFDINELIYHVLNTIKIRAEKKDLILNYEKLANFPQFVKGDEVKMRQVLLNLLENAVKYTNTGSVTLRVIYNAKANKNFLFEVIDTGIGIDKEKIGQIYEPFKQIGDQWKYIEGTGLGLAITKKIVDLMDGSLEVESEQGKGSLFRMRLNLPQANKELENSFEQVKIRGYKGERKKILAVDDNLTNLSFLVSALQPLGFEVHIAENGEKALEQAHELLPDLILMDLVMPVMDGIETIKKLRKFPKLASVKIIGITASVIEQGLRPEFIKICNDNVDKPVNLNELYKAIQKLLKLEWISENLPEVIDEVLPEGAPLLFPDESVLANMIDFAEIGNYQSIEFLMKTLLEDMKYFPFRRKIVKFIEKYDSKGLINYLKSNMS